MFYQAALKGVAKPAGAAKLTFEGAAAKATGVLEAKPTLAGAAKAKGAGP